MQEKESFNQQLFILCRNAIHHLNIAQGIFKILCGLNYCPSTAQDDEENSKKFANSNYYLIFDYIEEYEDQIFELEQIGQHPVIAHLKELHAVSDAALCLLLCIGRLGNEGSGGAARAGEYMIEKLKNQIEIHLPEKTNLYGRPIAA